MKYHVFNVRTNNRRLSWGEKIYETKNSYLILCYKTKVNMCLTCTETIRFIRDGEKGRREHGGGGEGDALSPPE